MAIAEKTERARGSLFSAMRNQQEINLNSLGFQSDEWPVNGSSIESYQASFDHVLNGQSLIEFTQKRLSPVVIDLMAPSATLRSLFEQASSKNGLGIAVALKDGRTREEIERDSELNIHQVTGDVLEISTWAAIEKKLAGRKADLIMERAMWGLDVIPNDEKFYAFALQRIWKLLSANNGMFVGGLPAGFRSSEQLREVLQWIGLAKRNGVDINLPPPYSYVKMVKKPDSPQDLRFLFKP